MLPYQIMHYAYPVLSCEEAAVFEKILLSDDESKIWSAMTHVGVNLGNAILQDFQELGPLPDSPKILVLAGKGHNAGDAILAAAQILKIHPNAQISILFALGEDGLRPLVQRALEALPSAQIVSLEEVMGRSFDICIDGILGMSFHPPVREPLASLINSINKHPNIRFRASVDIPSGLLFKSDFTYATGVAKTPLFEDANKDLVGRIRFIDIDFFNSPYSGPHSSNQFLLQSAILKPLKELRSPSSDKRKYGHVFILSGSKNYPGALMMSVKAAMKSGVGLITVFAPESLVPAFASEVPEAMWVPMPETASGSLALSGKQLLLEKLDKATALLTGPGLGDNPETLKLISEVVQEAFIPIAIDASALVPEVFESVKARPANSGAVLATPHLGELNRIAGSSKSLLEWSQEYNVTTLLKGSISKIAHDGIIYNSTFGGPVLARGGSGDILSGLVGGLLAQNPKNPLESLAQAVVWHGMAADSLARSKGQVAVRTTDLLDHLNTVLHN